MGTRKEPDVSQCGQSCEPTPRLRVRYFATRSIKKTAMLSWGIYCARFFVRVCEKVKTSIRVYERLEVNPSSTLKINIIVNVIIIAIIVILNVTERSVKQTRDTEVEIDVIEILNQMYHSHVALFILVYILLLALYRSLCCTERPVVVTRHQIGAQLCDLRSFRLSAS